MPPETVPGSAFSIAIGATFTVEPIGETLAYWTDELGLNCRIEYAPYNQVFQQLLDPGSLMASNENGINVLLIRYQDWAKVHDPGHIEDVMRQFAGALHGALGRWRSPVILVECPCSPGFEAGLGRERGMGHVRDLLAAAISDMSFVHLITAAERADLYPVREYSDSQADSVGHVPYTPEGFAALGTIVARKIDALRRPPYKVIALDADNTLWKGICSEDGPLGILLDDDRRFLQDFMRRQHDSGMLLCLASKNEEADLVAAFKANPEMPLRLGDFVARRVNWDPKSANLISLAEELSLGLDSFVFLDDNETETAEVRAGCPDVLSLTLPKEDTARFLQHVWAFDHPRVTKEDRERSAMYAQNVERVRSAKQAPSLADFLAGLQLDIRIGPVETETFARVSQLTGRTNQMNFSTRQRSEIEIRDLVETGGMECLTVSLSDRFGSYGLVGVMIFAARAGALDVDTFLLSCRALGKGVEHHMMARLGEIARARGLDHVDAMFVPTARNRPALNFLRSIEHGEEMAADGGMIFRFPPAALAGLRFHPVGPAQSEAARVKKTSGAGTVQRRKVDYQEIAENLWNPGRILKRAREKRAAAVEEREAGDAPRTGLERELVTLWRELLAVPSVGIHENFFDAGGHSLLAVQLLSHVRQEYGVELSPELVYDGSFTVETLARAIEVARIEGAGAEQYAALLAEVESLSDEEVRVLLAEEDTARD